jgi:hypothetical protein
MSGIDFITGAISKAFETGGNTSSYIYGGDTLIIHSEMNLDEVFEIFEIELHIRESSLILLEESIDNLLQKNLEKAEPRNSEAFNNMEEELMYEYDLYLNNRD